MLLWTRRYDPEYELFGNDYPIEYKDGQKIEISNNLKFIKFWKN